MPELYFRPLACSLASRIALMESGIEARYHQVDLAQKRVVGTGADFLELSSKGQVPLLQLDDGTRLTENVAVLQRIADLRPDANLAPPANDPLRYRLQEWLSFVATELHKAFLFPTFMPDTPDAVRAHARTRVPKSLDVIAAHLGDRPYVLGSDFSVADAYLIWALLLIRFAGVDLDGWPALAEYLERMQQRPGVGNAIAAERQLLQAS